MSFNLLRISALTLALAVISGPALAAKCGNGAGGFNSWLGQFKKEARKKGISQKTINSRVQRCLL